MSETITIYHNSRCSKSRCALELIEKKKIKPEIVEYLKTPPSEKQIKELLKMLDLKAEQVVRKGENLYKEKYKDKKITETEWIKILAKNPILIERPIVIKGNKAIIARPPELVTELLK